MVYVLSMDNPIPGRSSALGIRAFQLFRLCQEKVGKDKVKLLVSDSIKGKLPWEHCIRYEYPSEGRAFWGFDHFIKQSDTLIVPINCFRYKIFANYCKLVVDLLAPVLTEDMFMGMPIDIRINKRKSISELLDRNNKFLVGNKVQLYYWMGVMAASGTSLSEESINIVPLYMPFDGKQRLCYKSNKILLAMYGSYNPWIDLKATFELFSKFPKNYKLLFKGIGHPTFKRQKDKSIGEYVIKEYVKAMDKSVSKRVIIDPTWDDRKLEVNSGICLTQTMENEVSYKVRAIDMMGSGVPIICKPSDNLWNIFPYGCVSGLISNEDNVERIVALIERSYFGIKGQHGYDFYDIVLNNMEWLG